MSRKTPTRRRTAAALLAFTLVLVAGLFLAGCFEVTHLNVPSNIPATSNYTITMQLTPTVGGHDFMPTLAIRVPSAWDVTQVAYEGAPDIGAGWSALMARSAAMETYFATTWETKPVDAAHNGPKSGYKWWAGHGGKHDLQPTDVITLTITIDTHAVPGTYRLDFVSGMTDPDTPTNLAANANGMNWELGGVGDPPPGVRLDQRVHLTASQPTFMDVGTDHRYFDAIEGMAARGIINGYSVPGGQQFRPGNDVWRWQFAKMICGAMRIPVDESLVARFPDLGPDSPTSLEPHDYVAAATNANIIKGYGDGTFRAYTPISRAQVVTMVVRALRSLHPTALQTPPAGYRGTMGNFDPTHAENMRWADFNGLLTGLQGFGGTWDPWANMNRGEVAQVLWNAMAKLPLPGGSIL